MCVYICIYIYIYIYCIRYLRLFAEDARGHTERPGHRGPEYTHTAANSSSSHLENRLIIKKTKVL